MSKSKESKLPEISRRGFLMAALGMGLAACGKEAVATNTSPQTETPTPAPSAPETSSTPTETPTPEAPANTPEISNEIEWGSSADLKAIKKSVGEFTTMPDAAWNSMSFKERVPFLVAAGQAVSLILPDNPKAVGVDFSSQELCAFYDGEGIFENASSESVFRAAIYGEPTALGLLTGISELRNPSGEKLDIDLCKRALEAFFDTSNPGCANIVNNALEETYGVDVPNYGESTKSPNLSHEVDSSEVEYQGSIYKARNLVVVRPDGRQSLYTVIGANGVDHADRPAFSTRLVAEMPL